MRTVGYSALVAALVFVFAAIWWAGHQVESWVLQWAAVSPRLVL